MHPLAIALTVLALTACTAQNPPAEVPAPKAALPEAISNTYVKAEPVPGGKIRVSITAPDQGLYIVNCNEHIVVALLERGSTSPVWGGASDACLSPSIIVPAKATLGFTVDVSTGAQKPLTAGFYRAQIYHVLSGHDLKSAPVPVEQVTSNEFQLVP